VHTAAEAVRRNFSHPIGQYLARACDRTASHDDTARSVGAGGIRSQAGVAVNHGHAAGVDAENLACDLRQRSLKALSMRLNADPDFKAPIGRKANRRLLVTRYDR